jgi:predicted anti-sigma-YlaC factor YlaD
MTCRKAKDLIPLYAGGDLRPRLAARVRAHVDSCPSCREESREYQTALARVKAAAKAEGGPDWSEADWRALMARVADEGRPASEAAGGRRGPVLLPRWAAASVLGAAIGLAVLITLVKDGRIGERPGPSAAGPVAAGADRKQDVISVTMVSPESGLQVVWFLDKDFDWKGDKE